MRSIGCRRFGKVDTGRSGIRKTVTRPATVNGDGKAAPSSRAVARRVASRNAVKLLADAEAKENAALADGCGCASDLLVRSAVRARRAQGAAAPEPKRRRAT